MKFPKLIFSIICLIIFFSCSKNNEPDTNNSDAKRTIIVYMIASNNLGSNNFDKKDLAEMEKAVSNYDMNGCRLLVYHVTYDSDPILFEISRKDKVINRKTLKTYDNSSSVTTERLNTVIKDVQDLAPAKEYGLILWSHASGWPLSLPKDINYLSNNLKDNNSSLPLYRNFGQDRGKSMTISDLALGIPDNLFQFIYCDVCYMGCVEVAFQLRNKTKFFIGSPTLLPANGMPYDLNIPEFIKDSPNLKQACLNTFNHYNQLSGINKTLSISLIDCSKLEGLAKSCKILNSKSFTYNIDDLQGYIIKDEAKCIFFDLGQYYNTTTDKNSIYDFNKELSKCVIYKASTDFIFNKLKIEKENYSGLSTYILNTSNNANDQYYRTLDWYNYAY